MANKAISELPQAQNVNNQDLFVLEQSGIAKKLTAETFITEQGIIDALAEALDGHGGIQSVTLSNVSGRIRTYLITFTDESATTFQVYDGTSIDRIVKTSTAGLTDTYTVFMNDGTTSFFQVRNGQDGSATWDQINSKAPIITETVTGAIAYFPDGADDIPVKSLVANIEPKQDLTYGDPYPAGGGVNLLDPSTLTSYGAGYGLTSSISGDVITLSGTYTGSNTSASFRILVVPTHENWSFKAFEITTTGTINNLRWAGTSAASIVIDLQNLTPNAQYSIIFKMVAYEAGTTAPGSYVPYENICPISGHTEVNVTRTGKNLFSGDSEYTRTDAGYYIKTDTYSPMALNLVAGTYTISIKSTASGQGQLEIFGNSTSNRLINASMTMIVGTASYTFTINENCGYIRFYGNFVGTISDIQIEVGTTATAYEPYQGTTVTVDWTTEAGTVYGGTLDVTTGLLTVDTAIVTLSEFTGSVEGNGFRTNITLQNYNGGAYGDIKCNMFATAHSYAESGGSLQNSIGANASGLLLLNAYVNGAYLTSLSDVNALIPAGGCVITYPIVPQTYQLSGQQLNTLFGNNTVWADTGNVSVTYPADTKMFIEKLTQPTEDDMTANQAITSGKFFMVGNNLYIATAAIASGAKIIEGTNATRLSLADALNRL